MTEGRLEAGGSGRSRLVCLDDERVVEFGRAIVLGRHPLNDVVLDHPRISGRHAAIEWDGAAWRIRDLGSRNGTSVGQRRLRQPRTLREGDVVRLAGEVRWRVDRLRPPVGDVTLVRTATAGDPDGLAGLALVLGLGGSDAGVLRVVHPGGEWTAHPGQRLVLLHALASACGEWVPDEAVALRLWGRLGMQQRDPSALHKLIHDTRAMFREQGIDPWFVQKRGGRTRLALAPRSVTVLDGELEVDK